MGMTNALMGALLNQVYRDVTYTPPGSVYVALYTSAPTVTAPGTEVSAGGYARQAATLAAATTAPAGTTGIAVVSSADIVFGPSTASWGTVVGFGVLDAVIGGTLLCFGGVASTTIPSSSLVKILSGHLIIAIS